MSRTPDGPPAGRQRARQDVAILKRASRQRQLGEVHLLKEGLETGRSGEDRIPALGVAKPGHHTVLRTRDSSTPTQDQRCSFRCVSWRTTTPGRSMSSTTLAICSTTARPRLSCPTGRSNSPAARHQSDIPKVWAAPSVTQQRLPRTCAGGNRLHRGTHAPEGGSARVLARREKTGLRPHNFGTGSSQCQEMCARWG